ncbi:MAG: HlyD family efflux transporter periplasmic adaptor subunit [Gammaproteobacteria bacterium]
MTTTFLDDMTGWERRAAPQLPPLREDLRLYPGPTSNSGAPTWTLHDPVRNLFYRIGWREFELLSRWHMDNPGEIISDINRNTTLYVDEKNISALIQFLSANSLVIRTGGEALDSLAQQYAAKHRPHAGQLLQKYLFFRIPLLRPDHLLARVLPHVEFLYSRGFFRLLALLLVIGLFLTLRQWDSFLQTFSYLYSPAGIAWLLAALLLAKAAHELGHALTAKRYQLRVPTMGIAFLVFWPVLYTDTTDAWKLTSRRQRLQISAAGMVAEIVVAIIALLLWSLMPEGPARSAVFIIATTSWILTLFVNINPFLRFDGYHLLADYLETPNLQLRAFALARWKLREWLFGLDEMPQDTLPCRQQRLLILYAWMTWLYRLALFTGIGLLVYHLLFKLAGLLLLTGVVSWFIFRPVYMEMRAWHCLRQRLAWNRNTLVSLLLLGLLVLALVLPWNTHISAPAIIRYTRYAHLYPPAAGQLRDILVAQGDTVSEQQALFRLDSPELEHDRSQTARKIRMYELQLARQATRSTTIEANQVMQKQLAQAMSEQVGYSERLERLTIRSPLKGVVVEMADALTPGRWVNATTRLAMVVDTGALHIEAYIPETALARLSSTSEGEFFPQQPDIKPFPVRVSSISQAALTVMEEPWQASSYGGDIPVRQQSDGTLVPNQSFYQVQLLPVADAAPVIGHLLRGQVRIEGEPRSIITRVWQSVAAVVIRESGF